MANTEETAKRRRRWELAVILDKDQEVEQMIKEGYSVNQIVRGTTSLYTSLCYGKTTKVAQKLLENGAIVTDVSIYRVVELNFDRKFWASKIDSSLGVILDAIVSGHGKNKVEDITYLLERGCNIDRFNMHVCQAAIIFHKRLAEVLILFIPVTVLASLIAEMVC